MVVNFFGTFFSDFYFLPSWEHFKLQLKIVIKMPRWSHPYCKKVNEKGKIPFESSPILHYFVTKCLTKKIGTKFCLSFFWISIYINIWIFPNFSDQKNWKFTKRNLVHVNPINVGSINPGLPVELLYPVTSGPRERCLS